MKNEKDMRENPEAQEFVGTEPNFEAEERFEGDGQGADNVSDQELADAVNPATVAADADWKDKYMRLAAEFDNYRKRTLKEKMELLNMGGEDVIKSMLPVLDDMDRALGAMQTSEDIEAVRQGIELISHKLRETLKTKGLAEMECVGRERDTDVHEAVAKVPSPNTDDKGKIIDVAKKGYSLKDKVIRHAKVVVGE